VVDVCILTLNHRPYISGTLLGNDALEQLGIELLGAMTALKHNGAIEKAQMGFHALCSRQDPLHDERIPVAHQSQSTAFRPLFAFCGSAAQSKKTEAQLYTLDNRQALGKHCQFALQLNSLPYATKQTQPQLRVFLCPPLLPVGCCWN